MRRLMAMTLSRDQTRMVKEWGASAQNGVGAVVEWLERWDDATTMNPGEGGGEQLGWQLAGQLDSRIVPRQRKSRGI
jgi:hypothetical protein